MKKRFVLLLVLVLIFVAVFVTIFANDNQPETSNDIMLPPTGGIGTKVFTAAGIVLVSASGTALIIHHHKNKDDNDENDINI